MLNLKKLFNTLFLASFITLSYAHAEPGLLTKSFDFKSYKEASTSKEFVRFDMKSTKAGLITTGFNGYARKFKLTGTLENGMINHPTIEVDSKSLDTDIDARNEKMWSLCLKADQFQTFKIISQTPIDLKAVQQTLTGVIQIIGHDKPITISLKTSQEGNQYVFEATANLKLSELEIPDPSIFIAKVKDDIAIQMKITQPIDLVAKP